MKIVGRWVFLVGSVALHAGCSSKGEGPPAETNDDTQEDGTSASATTLERATSHASGTTEDTVHDAGGVSDPGSTSARESDAATSVSSGLDTTAPTSSESDASLILEPEFEQLSVAQLCEQIARLEGQSVDVDLTGELRTSDWRDVASDAPSLDAGLGGAVDAMACSQRFAVYVAPCSGSVLVVTAPTLVFGQGPVIGGEEVGLGCWEAECAGGCLPETSADVGKVRVRIALPLNPNYDEVLAVDVGDIRVNGVDIEGIGQLEVLERL